MKRLMLLSSALLLSATMSLSAMTADDLVAAYQAQGYTRIEVKTGLTQFKVEAVKGSVKVEVIYDAATGAILKQESQRASRAERGTGVEISAEDGDFLSDDGGSDDDMNDDGSDDHEDAVDDHEDDHEDALDDHEDDHEDASDDRKDDRKDGRDERDDDEGDDHDD